MKTDLKDYVERMKKQIGGYENMLSSVRAGRANPAILDKINVDYYGTPTPIAQVAAVAVPDARTIVITPWEAATLKVIEKAINTSDLGINPNNDGKAIRLAIQPLTEDKRKELTKQVSKMSEEAKVHIRNVRRDANDKFKAQKKKSDITEDDLKVAEKDTQELADKYIKMIDEITAKKNKEIMEI
jgi:ribosome recycling factor